MIERFPYLQCSHFRHALDNAPRLWGGGWEGFQAFLEQEHHPYPALAQADPKKALPAFSPARFLEGTTRARDHVRCISMIVGDFDNAREVETGEFHLDREGCPTNRPILRKVCIENPVTPHEVLASMARAGVTSRLYTTWSHTPAWPRFRMVIPLEAPIPPEVLEFVVEYAFQELGLSAARRGVDEPVLGDTARIHFLPALPPSGILEHWSSPGGPLVVDMEKLARIRVKPPQEALWQKKIRARRALDGRWDSRTPYDLKTLDLAGLLSLRGIQVGAPRPFGPSIKWRTHCPWAHEHSHGLDDDAGVIFHREGSYPVWHCSHSHHLHLGLRDILEWIGGIL